jgi:plastocyanin
MPLPRSILALVLAAAVLTLAGCGQKPKAVGARDGHVAMTLDDYLLSPQTVRARAGTTTFDVVNKGRVGHSFRIRKGDHELLRITTLLPGERERASVDLPRGDYRMFCAIANHEELGMYGTLVVR